MNDLISRQAAIDIVKSRKTAEQCEKGVVRNWAVDLCVDALEKLPSAQPEPRTAYWTKDIVGSVVCSNCGGIREDNRIGHTQWCNCCGCFMRDEEND